MNRTQGPVLDTAPMSNDPGVVEPDHAESKTLKSGQPTGKATGGDVEALDEQSDRQASDLALEGTGDLGFRVVAVYVFALMVVGLDWVLAKVDGTPRLHYVPLTQSAPVLTAGATIALGLHVAVYNLTHGAEIEPYTGRILARLRLFADTGLAVAILAAGSGVLMMLPSRGGEDPNPPLDVLGFALSVVVAATACLAAHIIPADVTSRVANTQRSRDERWLGRAVRHWDEAPERSVLAWSWRAVWVLALLVLPIGLGEYTTSGGSLVALWDGVVAGAAFALLPAIFLISFATLLHRDYVFAFVLSAVAVSSTVFIVVLLWNGLSSAWQQLLAVGCALWPWWILLRSAAPAPRRRLCVLPRVARRSIWWSLNWRYGRLTPRDKPPSRLSLLPGRVTRRAVQWFKRATGRTEKPAKSEPTSRDEPLAEATTVDDAGPASEDSAVRPADSSA